MRPVRGLLEDHQMKDEALKLALEGAANYIDVLGGDSRKYRQALAAQPAPAAFEVSIVEWVGNKLMATPKNAQEFTCSTGLCHYKAQRQWVGLSGEEIQTIWRHSEHMDVNEVCRAIEAKLKELNT
jgi:hypothetical protein